MADFKALSLATKSRKHHGRVYVRTRGHRPPQIDAVCRNINYTSTLAYHNLHPLTPTKHRHVGKKRKLPCRRRPKHVLQTGDTGISKTRREIYTIQTLKRKRIFQESWLCQHVSSHCTYSSRISQNVQAIQRGEITELDQGQLRVRKA